MTERDEEREERISMRIIVDAYTVEEQAYGWHAYLDDLMDFPFEARCTTEREESPLKEGETVRVVGMSSTEPTLSQQYVTVEMLGGATKEMLLNREPRRSLKYGHYNYHVAPEYLLDLPSPSGV